MARAGSPAWDEDEAFFDERPARRARRTSLPWLRATVMSSLIVGGLAYMAERTGGETPVTARKKMPAPVLIAPAPAWTPIVSASVPFAVEKSSLAPAVEARQHTSGAREDTLTYGRFGQPGYLRITFVQGFSEPARSFFVDIVRRAAEAGLAVARNSLSRMVATKFGPVEAATVTLAGTREQECQAFRFSDRDSGFGFQGWTCGADAGMDDAQLACFIDGIALAGGSSPSVRVLFARAEKSRPEACGMALRAGPGGVRTPLRP